MWFGNHDKFWRTIPESIPCPIAESTFNRLEHATPCWSALRPVISGIGPYWCQWLILIIGIIWRQPGRCQTNLKTLYWLIDQRPYSRIKSHTLTKIATVSRSGGTITNVAMKAAVVLLNNTNLIVIRFIILCFTYA